MTKLERLDETEECFINEKTMVFTFSVWSQTVNKVSLDYFGSSDGVFVLIQYGSRQKELVRTFGGEAWTSDSNDKCTNQEKASLQDVAQFVRMMAKEHPLKVGVFFDGQLCVEKDTDLHLRFDHPISNRVLLIKQALTCSNPLTVLDQLQ